MVKYWILSLLVIFSCSTLYAQQNTDSARIARQRILDSTRKAQQHYNDSVRIARERVLDSTRKAQKAYNDSVREARVRKIDSTRKAQQAYNDSLRKARQHTIDSTRKAQQAFNDSVRVARMRIIDSTRKAQQAFNDSVRIAREHILDSTRKAQKRYFDSVRVVRQRRLDSVKAERKRISDSLAVIREYRQSQRYKDSVAAVRQARLDSIKTVRQHKLDSIKAERKRVTDSIVAVRKAYVDSIRAVQKHRSDSLARIREYRQSKRYKDSVQVVRKMKLDSIKSVRKAYYDSVKTERQRVNDSIAAERKAYTDSVMAIRKAYTDSLRAVRKARSDSLAKLKVEREKQRVVREKQREDKAKLALQLKIKKKREAYNNEQMLKKRWGFPRSIIQNTFTRFNYHFNADQKMDEALANMQRMQRENYDSLIALFPFNPDKDSTVFAADMDSIIRKASLGIQIHDPRTKWGDDLYLLLGQAYFYKGDYNNAENAFKYVVSLRDKNKRRKKRRLARGGGNSIVMEERSGLGKLLMHRSVHNEAILWLARAYTQQHKEGEAESVLDLIETDPNFSGSLKGRLALEEANIRLSQKDYRGAIEPLTKVTDDDKLPNWIRMRAAYINGQLLQRYEDYTASANSFKKALELHPKIEMDFNAKKNMATSLMMAGGEQDDAIAVLKKILTDAKYVKYYEQVYFLLGELSVNAGNNDDAVTYLKKSISAPKSTDPQKAKSYAALGDVYYNQRLYENAKDAYDSASVYGADVASTPNMETAMRRSVVLQNLTDPLAVIKHNDSLLHLASLDEKEQKSVARKYIKMLEDRRADSIFKVQNAGLTAALKSSSTNAGNRKNNYENWYFSNAAQMQRGYNDFKQKWGSRPLIDNWRLSSSSGFSQGADNEEGDEDPNTDAHGIPTEDYLLSLIPNTKEGKDTLNDANRKAYVDAANAYVKDLEDYPPAISLLDTLDERYPKHEYKPEIIYLRYIIALRQSRFDDAKKYRDALQENYADTKWAQLATPTEDGEGLDGASDNVVTYYDETYQLLIDREFDKVLPRAKEGLQKFDVPVYKDRFQIMEAMASASLGNFTTADSVLADFMRNHTDPNDSLRRWADAIMKYINDNRNKVPQQPVTGNATKGSTGDTTQGKMGGNVPSAKTPKAPANYKYEPKQEHYVLFAFKTLEQRTKGVQAAIEDFNKFRFGSLKLEVDLKMLNSVDGVIYIKTFTNRNQAIIYMNTLKKTKQVFREYQAKEYDIVMISKLNFDKLLSDKDINAYLNFYRSKY